MPGRASSDSPGPPVAFSRATTRGVAPRERFEYWRELFVASYIDRPDREAADDFQGQLRGCVDADGVGFANLRADPIVCSFGRRDSDMVLLGHVRRGRVGLRDGGGETDISGGELVLLDCDRPAVSIATRYDLSYLALPRALVRHAMGRDPSTNGAAAVSLPASGLSALLRSHLDGMAEHWDHMDAAEAAAALEAAASLAVAVLARFHHRQSETRESLDDVLLRSACRHMEAQAHRPDLTADLVAAALGCSRAHLYRLFGLRDQTVAGALREIRLCRARRLVETRPHEPLGSIAFACGYTDLSAFGKAFRRRFAMSPTECRGAAGNVRGR